MTSARIQPLRDADLPPEVRRLRAAAPPLALSATLARAVTTFPPLNALAIQMFQGVDLTGRARELAILTVAHAVGCDYVWTQHEPIAAREGITDTERDAIRSGDLNAEALPGQDRALIRFTAAVVAGPKVGDDAFAAVYDHLSARQIVELLELIGLYWTYGRVITVLQIPNDPPCTDAVLASVEDLRVALEQES